MNIKILHTGMKSSGSRSFAATENDLSHMVTAYNPAYHEAPVFIGNGGDTDPAVCWVASLCKIGSELFAKIQQMDRQVEERKEVHHG